MKRIANLWPKVTAFENIYCAYRKARKGKQQRQSVAGFSLNLEQELLRIQRALVNDAYQPGNYRQFIVRERKPRLISAAPFVDRVMHHALMNVLEPELDKRFYFHSYACRKNKGVHRAVNQYQAWAKDYAYVMKLDIARYFPSIKHDVLKRQLRHLCKDRMLLGVLDKIIDASPCVRAGVGIPIGNLTSQIFANIYLNGIDHWLKHILKVPAYLRYVDDLILLGDNKQQLWAWRNALVVKLADLGLELHHSKQQLMRTSERVDVLGYKVSAKRRWLRNDNGYRFQRKLKSMAKRFAEPGFCWSTSKASVQSWIGHALHGETLQLRSNIFQKIVFVKGERSA